MTGVHDRIVRGVVTRTRTPPRTDRPRPADPSSTRSGSAWRRPPVTERGITARRRPATAAKHGTAQQRRRGQPAGCVGNRDRIEVDRERHVGRRVGPGPSPHRACSRARRARATAPASSRPRRAGVACSPIQRATLRSPAVQSPPLPVARRTAPTPRDRSERDVVYSLSEKQLPSVDRSVPAEPSAEVGLAAVADDVADHEFSYESHSSAPSGIGRDLVLLLGAGRRPLFARSACRRWGPPRGTARGRCRCGCGPTPGCARSRC